ncbi:MAG: glycosyl hydrolase 115 family protein [Flavisolibacter sp.]
MKKQLLLAQILFCYTAINAQVIISEKNSTGAFPLVVKNQTSTILFDANEEVLIQKAAMLFQNDIEMVTGKKPGLSHSPTGKNIIIIGSLHSKYIQQLVKSNKLKTSKLTNQWEAYQVQIIRSPFKDVDNALVITGSDRRGTAYGVFEVSRQIGVSPWYWWADVPVKKKDQIYVSPNAFISSAPKVKYRGIFINDEAPALSNWSKEKFGGFNHQFYEKVFELILRNKGNYLWPAMWGNAFYDDDSLNMKSADDYGIVIGTSHHEPLMRAHDEWRRYGTGKWDYDSNEVRLKEFWKKGMQRATNEKIVSIGMRGDGDMPMSRETATALLERIVKDQRNIIEEVTHKPASQTPQLWALYKEVQDYYDKGMRVPDDVTLLLCDDNWGNIRKLPKLTDKPRSGGYGIYYHFDYVGGPRNYKWINTNNIARVWEQMHLAYSYGVDKIWIVNVGDIKPMEFPISFFLDYAWDPSKWNEDNLRDYYTNWAEEQFGNTHAKAIGDVLRRYSLYSSRRKPELLDDKTYGMEEAERVLAEWKLLEHDAEEIGQKLPAEYRDAYFELVQHPIQAFANLHNLYHAVALNKLSASENSSLTNQYAQKATELYTKDSLITVKYHQLANGKWNHMMDQTHIGYTYWQQPPVNKMPILQTISEKEARPADEAPTLDIQVSVIPDSVKGNAFYQEGNHVSIHADHWTRAVNSKSIKWKLVPDIGKDGNGITSFPVTATAKLSTSGPHVEYEFYTFSKDSLKVSGYFSPTLNFHSSPNGLQFAISVDEEAPQIVSLNKEDNTGVWNSWVANNIIIKTSNHFISQPGKHILKYWMIDPGIILQKLVVDFGGIKPSYLGPPETLNKK